ncbi:dnaJ homolog subfamily C member 30, mitochondrial-like [Amphibalanus amphitrite]|uniref:dnaJ homolog subfamily C member 30, mitochondrial-like n=1 Tax=Amphibalanus amphitrite TaxID=1232801 RepID=UPI001C907651|nr:dnaJ homolog subfamily C member 30, mitochondrial-like [Amphibalanus amphitrite]XP_043244438.1 dnaJ homolog subfamily C member 30, mitochondrial-like [Amphibalanus amphitrite]
MPPVIAVRFRAVYSSPVTAPCASCGRPFVDGRRQEHERICARLAGRRRSVYDSQRHRLAGTEHGPLYARARHLPAPPVRESRWRQRHEELVTAVRAARSHTLCGWRLLQRPGVLTTPAICGGSCQRDLSSAEPNFYDVLGVTPRSSSKHIKAAYFRLSKKYHPDRKSGNAIKFQQISAAYEVLGNRHRRRVYDSGRHHGHGHHGHQRGPARHGPDFHAPPAGRSATPHTGRSAHFDYDAWSQAHYQELRSRETKSREEYAMAAEKQRDRREERVRGFVVCAAILAMAAYVGLLTDDGLARGGASPARPPPPPPP